MGASRSAPDPKFEENLKAATEMPEGMGRATSLINTFTDGSNIMGRTGRSTMSGLGASGGTGLQNAIAGIVKPSASATIKAPEPTPEPESAPSMQMFVGGGLESDEAFSRRTGLTKVDPTTEERIKDLEVVKDDLLAKSKERRSKISEMKEEAMSRMSLPSPSSGIDKFAIENYRAGGADFDRDDTKTVGDDMATGKPSAQERVKSFLGETMTDPGGFAVRVRSV